MRSRPLVLALSSLAAACALVGCSGSDLQVASDVDAGLDTGSAYDASADGAALDAPGDDAAPDTSLADAPADTTPADATVADTNPTDTAADTTPADATVADTKPTDATVADTNPSDAPLADAKDAAADASDAPVDSAGACLAAGACAGFPSSFVNDATDVANCAGAEHEINCCGARRIFGINHGVRTTFCPAETTCRSAYPAAPGCTDATITTDTGETTTDVTKVRVRCVSPSGGKCTCQTFLCADATCAATSVPIGACM
jgi:hypothetical protein